MPSFPFLFGMFLWKLTVTSMRPLRNKKVRNSFLLFDQSIMLDSVNLSRFLGSRDTYHIVSCPSRTPTLLGQTSDVCRIHFDRVLKVEHVKIMSDTQKTQVSNI